MLPSENSSFIRFETELNLGRDVSELRLMMRTTTYLKQVSIGAILRLIQDELKSGTSFPNMSQP